LEEVSAISQVKHKLVEVTRDRDDGWCSDLGSQSVVLSNELLFFLKILYVWPPGSYIDGYAKAPVLV